MLPNDWKLWQPRLRPFPASPAPSLPEEGMSAPAPTGSSAPVAAGVAGGMAADAAPTTDPGQQYICGFCSALNYLKAGDVIRCRKCGHRIFYKARTRRVVQYEAR